MRFIKKCGYRLAQIKKYERNRRSHALFNNKYNIALSEKYIISCEVLWLEKAFLF